MIQHILLVAAREFRQIAATRSFWLTLLILPVALAIGAVAPRLMEDSDTERVVLIDARETAAAAIRERLEIDEQRRILEALSRYSQRYELDDADQRALWAQHDRWYSDDEVRAFVEAGGADAALATMRRAAGEETPEFDAPEPWYELVETPADLANAAPGELDARADGWLDPSEESGRQEVDYIVFVPADFGSEAAPVRIWSDGRVSQGFVQTLQQVLTRDLRTRYLLAAGLSSEQAATASTLTPAVAVSTPPPGGGRERVLIRSVLPLLSAYMLLMSLLLSGSWMLQGVVEERSNKLIETVLACVSPNELLYGKLFGTVAVGLVMVLFWTGCAVFAAFATQSAVAEFLRPALAPLASPGTALTMLYFFLAGYLMVSMIFLAIGAMSDSFRDSQSYLTPVILVIAMPFAFIAQAVLREEGGLLIQLMTWTPLYTPFTMLARLGTGVPLWELLGAGALLALFIVLEFVFLGRVFRASLLSAGEKPTLARIGQLMRRRSEV
ncbi:ABC transporter permease [Sphingosinithalassobacter sp. CS137]|uniref:ABC transporter permease n=1 Tax=Sphingosinithalassobacter sp. CS137 TaxID=2762748 RepID=UPI00165E5843|nr:ABC transporter permease [Sphingosinithalassobacter sp. CS137]